MDSLSQLVLGAATGELVLGRKLGNRALWLGALGGTLPDLDVLAGLWLDPLENLAFHRGITHSALVWVLGGLGLGTLSHRVQRKGPAVGWGQWVLFWFAVLATHVLLDCFTLYGTQVWAPFSNARVSWSTISVADPLYTLPFLLALLVMARKGVGTAKRRRWHRLAWAWSCLYLAWTVTNKFQVEAEVREALTLRGITAQSVVTTPTILNNVLWSVAVDEGDGFYVGHHSLLDEGPLVLHRVEKGPGVGLGGQTEEVLRWFSDGFLVVTGEAGDTLQLADLRFGSFATPPVEPTDYIFRFVVRREEGGWGFVAAEGGPPPGRERDFFPALWNRIWGGEAS